MSKLKRNLDAIWSETTNNTGGGRRYVAKSIDGRIGWGVYDRRTGRFLKDREVAALTPDQVRQPEHLQ